MHKAKHLFFTVLFVFSGIGAYCGHIIGGYLSYECIGPLANNNSLVTYEVTLKLYVDCGPSSSPNPLFATISIFNEFDVPEQSLSLSQTNIARIPDGSFNPCVVEDTTLCALEETYRATITLDADEPKKFVYQRCCRNVVIDNIPNPEGNGVTYVLNVPAYTNLQNCNHTPQFTSPPPLSFCKDFGLTIDLSATDQDATDSLAYSICAPLNYSSKNVPAPNPANPPPYSELPFLSPQSGTNPIPSNPQFSIDQNGILSGQPTQLGQYVIGYCVEEYKNNVLINTVRRDIQIIVENCQPIITTAVQDQEQFCEGYTVDFENNSSSNDLDTLLYLWNFGDPTTQADTSRLKEPTYTYPDTGEYTITLITNPYYPCSDTSTETYRVYPLLDPDIDYFGRLCEDSNSVSFAASGQFEPYATFEWEFFNASIGGSTSDSVFDVSFNDLNPEVQLIVSENGCEDTVLKNISFFPNPIANFTYDTTEGCYPLPVNFQNLSSPQSNANFEWKFGDGNTSNAINPSYTYNQNGYFDVSLIIETTDKCIDTDTFKIDSAIYTSLELSNNKIDFEWDPKIGCPPLKVDFSEKATYDGKANFIWDFGDGNSTEGSSVSHSYSRSDYYDVGLMMITSERCIDTLVKTLDSVIYVQEKPSALLLVSDSTKSIKEADFTFDGTQGLEYTTSYFLIDGKKFDGNYLNYTFNDTGHFSIQQILTNNLGCTDTASAEVFVYDEFEFIIPNIFTPNTDGINDYFAPKGIGIYDYEVEIFNRFGEKVFFSNSFNIQWDGRIQGKKAQSGVYFYTIRVLDFNSKYRTYKGSLTLLRE
ncbi:MAG: hypothetical protein CMC96_07190 [Flavobacteriales bacterium]|nr:hypothetical protein [Flavobacteriales bacterium]|tara:strand:+ start:1209 stop:3656 length:2448 start_codon:yes stop_codon:yes gene_type:complete